MRILATGRVMGKTTKMINWMKANPDSVCVVFAEIEADRLRRENRDINPSRFVTITGVKRGVLRGKRIKIGVDNLDIILQDLIGPNIDLVTATAIPYETEA
jgi:hypothetical protein